MILAIDFDGTIVDHQYPEIGDLKPNAVETIQQWHNAGHQIIIWTCRHTDSDIIPMKEFLNENKIPYDAINDNVGIKSSWQPFPKILADIH